MVHTASGQLSVSVQHGACLARVRVNQVVQLVCAVLLEGAASTAGTALHAAVSGKCSVNGVYFAIKMLVPSE